MPKNNNRVTDGDERCRLSICPPPPQCHTPDTLTHVLVPWSICDASDNTIGHRNMPRRSHLFTHEPPSPVSSSVFSLCSVGDAPPTSTLISASHSLHRLLTASTPSISHTLTHSHTQRAGTNTSCTAASFQVPHPITAGKHTGYRNEKEINKTLRKSSNTFCPFH